MSAERPFAKKSFGEIVDDLLAELASGRGGIRLTDDTEGSVVRTLSEAFARELAVCYEQLERVHRAGYVATATGAALDNVVALLGMERQRGGVAAGTVRFSRLQSAPGDIDIPAGTRIAGRDVPPFETTIDGVLPEGETVADVPARSIGPAGPVEPGRLTVMTRPVPGIDAVTNPTAMVTRTAEETDDELRARARRALDRAARGTLPAIREAVREFGVKQVLVAEDHVERPGVVHVVVGDSDVILGGEEAFEPLLEQIRERVEDVRPAGILAEVVRARAVLVQLTVSLELKSALAEAQKTDLRRRLEADLAAWFEALEINEDVRASELRALLGRPGEVAQLRATPGDRGPLPFLDPRLRGADGSLGSELETRLLRAGTLYMGAGDRAVLDDLRLTLVDPALSIFVDVAVRFPPGTAIGDDYGLQARLRLRRFLRNVPPDRPVPYSTWVDQLPAVPRPDAVTITVIHDADGRVAVLSESAHADFFVEGEIRTLRDAPDPNLGGDDPIRRVDITVPGAPGA